MVFNPGSTVGEMSRPDCITQIASEINLALSATRGVTVVLENMSRQGNTIGGDLQELADIIALVEDKTGQLWLYTLNMDMMIHGGTELPEGLYEEANNVKKIILDIMHRGAEGDF